MADPTVGQVPRECRSGLQLNTAFTCGVDRRVYLTRPYVARLQSASPHADAALRFAATMSHEMGHVMQFAVREPLILRENSAAESRQVEQQADCLSGVWADAAGIPAARFRAAVASVLAIVDNAAERHTHGTPAQRLAAVARGQRGGTAAACGLALH